MVEGEREGTKAYQSLVENVAEDGGRAKPWQPPLGREGEVEAFCGRGRFQWRSSRVGEERGGGDLARRRWRVGPCVWLFQWRFGARLLTVIIRRTYVWSFFIIFLTECLDVNVQMARDAISGMLANKWKYFKRKSFAT